MEPISGLDTGDKNDDKRGIDIISIILTIIIVAVILTLGTCLGGGPDSLPCLGNCCDATCYVCDWNCNEVCVLVILKNWLFSLM